MLLLGGAAVHVSLLARERRARRETIRKGERRFRTMFEEAPMGIALIDSATGEFKDINPRYAQIAGRSFEEIRSGHWADFVASRRRGRRRAPASAS